MVIIAFNQPVVPVTSGQVLVTLMSGGASDPDAQGKYVKVRNAAQANPAITFGPCLDLNPNLDSPNAIKQCGLFHEMWMGEAFKNVGTIIPAMTIQVERKLLGSDRTQNARSLLNDFLNMIIPEWQGWFGRLKIYTTPAVRDWLSLCQPELKQVAAAVTFDLIPAMPPAPPPPAPQLIEGTDLCRFNEVDYAACAKKVRYAYVNVWAGKGLDGKSELHHAGLKQYNIPCGPYFVGDYTQYAAPQAAHLLALAAGYELIPALDLEFVEAWDLASGGRPNGPKMRAWLRDFYAVFDQLYKGDSLLYINGDMIEHYLRDSSGAIPDFILKRKLWMAAGASPAAIAPWKEFAINQYRLDTPVDWADGDVDLDRCPSVDALKLPSPIQPPVFQPYQATVTATAGLNVRKLPAVTALKVGALQYKTTVTILEEQAGWGRIAALVAGWISLSWTKRVSL